MGFSIVTSAAVCIIVAPLESREGRALVKGMTMDQKRINENLISIGDDELRVERGWRRVLVTATPEALRASGRRVPEPGAPVVFDAMGKPVTLGQPMTVLDRNRSNLDIYLYRWERTTDAAGNEIDAFVEKEIIRGPGPQADSEAWDKALEDAAAACIQKYGMGG